MAVNVPFDLLFLSQDKIPGCFGKLQELTGKSGLILSLECRLHHPEELLSVDLLVRVGISGHNEFVNKRLRVNRKTFGKVRIRFAHHPNR